MQFTFRKQTIPTQEQPAVKNIAVKERNRVFDQTQKMEVQHSEPVKELPINIKGSLLILNGAGKGKLFVLDKAFVILGRNEENYYVINDSYASGFHAAIFFSKSMEWRIRDLGSKNGTYLNGSRVTEYALRFGDKILIGEQLMIFEND